MGAASTAKLLASLDLDSKGFTRGVDQAMGGLGKLEGRLGRIGGLAAQGAKNAGANLAAIGVVAGGVIATQVYAGIRSLEELERAVNATEGVIKSTGGAAGVTAKQIRDMSEALESVTTADDKVIQGGANLLLTFTNIGETVFPKATKAVVDLGIAMAQGDVENADYKASAIQIGKALNDPIKGITALTRVGVSFTQQQKDQIKAMVEAGDVIGAQTIILNELEREFGEAGAAAGKGFGADIRRVKDAVEEAQQALATGFLPVIQKVADILQRELAKPSTIAAIKSFGESLAGGLDSLIKVAGNIPWGVIGESMKIAGASAKVLFDAFVSLPPWVQTAVITGWGLNKLTGGALGGIVGELGKGLIKGVLGINAGVVNVKGAVVNGGGVGGAGAGAAAGGAASRLGTAVRVLGTVALAAGSIALIGELLRLKGEQTAANQVEVTNLATQTEKFTGTATLEDMKKSLAGIEKAQHDLAYGSIFDPATWALAFNIDGVRDSIEATKAALATAIAKEETALGAKLQRIGEIGAGQNDAIRAQVSAVDRTNQKLEDNRAATAAGTSAMQRAADALERKQQQAVNVTVNVATQVTVKDIARKTLISNRLGFAVS